MPQRLIRKMLYILSMALEVMTFFHQQPLTLSSYPSSVQWSNTNKRSDKGTTEAHGNDYHTSRLLRLQVEKSRIGQSLLHLDCSGGGRTEQERSADSSSMERKIFNPITKRYIKQTSGTTKKGSSRWQKFMYEEGGYIAHCGKLVPITLELLRQTNDDDDDDDDDDDRSPANERETDYDVCKTSHSTNLAAIDRDDWYKHNEWNQILPSLKIMDSIDTPERGLNSQELLLPAVDQLLFVHKPAKLLTLPGIGPEKSDCLAFRVNKWLRSSNEGKDVMTMASISNKQVFHVRKKKKERKRKKKKAPFEPRPCHRLDFDTSGVMVVALSPTAHQATSMLFERRFVEKTYVALVVGHLEHDFGMINLPVGKVYSEEDGYNKFACLIPPAAEGSRDSASDLRQLEKTDFVDGSLRDAITDYKVSQRFTLPLQDGGRKAKYTRVILNPRTGRGHQLRLHMEAIGHSILGDQLHAPKNIASCTPCLCLHAESIQMPSNVYSKDDSIQICQVIAHQTAPF